MPTVALAITQPAITGVKAPNAVGQSSRISEPVPVTRLTVNSTTVVSASAGTRSRVVTWPAAPVMVALLAARGLRVK